MFVPQCFIISTKYNATWRGTFATFWVEASPKNSQQMFLVADRINSSSVLKGFLSLVMWLATYSDAITAHPLMKRWSSVFDYVHCIHLFFFWKKIKGLSLNIRCFVSMWNSSFEHFMTLLDCCSPHKRSRLGEYELPASMSISF